MYSATLKAEVLCISEDSEGSYVYNCLTDNFTVNEFVNIPFNDTYKDFSLSRFINIFDTSVISDETGYHIIINAKAIYKLDLTEDLCQNITEDIYSVEKKIELTKEQIQSVQITTLVKDIIHVKDSPKINFPAQINKALCPAWEIKIKSKTNEEIRGELSIKTLILNSSDGKFSTQNTIIPFVKPRKSVSGDTFIKTYLKNLYIDTVSDRLMIEADIGIEEFEFMQNNSWKIKEINISDYEISDENYTKIKVHYFSKNDSLWEIAKNNRTTVEKIMAINEIDDVNRIAHRFPLIIR